MVPILQAHDLRARALELALELGDLRRRLRVRFHHALDHRLRRPRLRLLPLRLLLLELRLVLLLELLLLRRGSLLREREHRRRRRHGVLAARLRLLRSLLHVPLPLRLLLLLELRLLLRIPRLLLLLELRLRLRQLRLLLLELRLRLRLLRLLRVARARERRVDARRVDVDAVPPRALERLRQALLKVPVRLLELVDGARVDVVHGSLRRELVALALSLHHEAGLLPEAQRVRELLQHRELPRGQAQLGGVLALPLGAVSQLVAQPPAVLLELVHFVLELRVERAQLRSLHLAPDLEVAQVDVGVLGNARLLPQEPRLLGEVLDFATELVGGLHRVLHLLVGGAHLQAQRLQVAHRLAQAVHALLVLGVAPRRFRELVLRLGQRAVHRFEPLVLLTQRFVLHGNLRLEVGVVPVLALQRDVNLATDILLQLVVRLEKQNAQVPKLSHLRLELLDVPRVVGVEPVGGGAANLRGARAGHGVLPPRGREHASRAPRGRVPGRAGGGDGALALHGRRVPQARGLFLELGAFALPRGVLLGEALLKRHEHFGSLLEVALRGLQLRGELVALAPDRLRGSLDVRLFAPPRLRGVVQANDGLRVPDALRHERLDLRREALILIRQHGVFLLVPRNLLVALRRSLRRGGILAHLRLHLARLVREALLHLLDVVLGGARARRRLVQSALTLARLRDVALELLLERLELLRLQGHSPLSLLRATSRGVRLSLEGRVRARAAALELLHLLVHDVQLAILLLDRHLQVLRAHRLVLAAELQDHGEAREAVGVRLGVHPRVRLDARLLQLPGQVIERGEGVRRDVLTAEKRREVEAHHRVPRHLPVLGHERVGGGLLGHRGRHLGKKAARGGLVGTRRRLPDAREGNARGSTRRR